MSKIKRSLPEDYDVTDRRDLSCTLDDDLPDVVDFAVQDYLRAVDDLAELGAMNLMHYATELSDADAKIGAIMDDVIALSRKPF